MSSERRLHPYSILFAFLTQIRLFVIPGILLAIGASSRSNDWWEWQPWMMLLIIPNAVLALIRYFTYVFRFDESELVIRSGLIFRRERHIPYARIQNIDAVQNVLHRLLAVADIKIETGGSDAAEATMSVLPLSALDDIRERVLAKRDGESIAAPDVAPAPPLVALRFRDLMLCGFIDNRGGVIFAAALGLMWEFGMFDRLGRWWFGGMGDRPIRTLLRGLWSTATVSAERVAISIGVLVVLLVIVRVASMLWAVVRLHGFTLSLINDDLRREFGLLTHVALTIPRRRVQALTVREGWLHRYFGRVALRVDTAGGHAEGQEAQQEPDREYLVPILRKEAVTDLVQTVIGVDLRQVDWRPPHPNALRREVKRWLAAAVVIAAVTTGVAGWYAVAALPLLLAWALVVAHQTIKHLRWAETGDAILLTTGWLTRRTIVVRFGKIQVVTRHESPFDRRHAMASLHVDTAGASSGSVMHIRYLDRLAAGALHARLAAVAARTELRW
jgi:putative membrane protein